ncbi:MAG: hypothetical protein AAFQ77_04005, partial [Myxococcota bacterium]
STLGPREKAAGKLRGVISEDAAARLAGLPRRRIRLGTAADERQPALISAALPRCNSQPRSPL